MVNNLVSGFNSRPGSRVVYRSGPPYARRFLSFWITATVDRYTPHIIIFFRARTVNVRAVQGGRNSLSSTANTASTLTSADSCWTESRNSRICISGGCPIVSASSHGRYIHYRSLPFHSHRAHKEMCLQK